DDEDDEDDGRGPDTRYFALRLPSWLDFDGDDRLFGTPDADDVGEHRVRLMARLRSRIEFQTFTITVHPGPVSEPPPPPPAPEPQPAPEPPPPATNPPPAPLPDVSTVRAIQTLAARDARGIAVRDFDGDGRDDLAVAAAAGVLVF